MPRLDNNTAKEKVKNQITCGNSALKNILTELDKLGDMMLDAGVFNDRYRKIKERMQLLRKKARNYCDELQHHENIFNYKLVNDISTFLQEEISFIKENTVIIKEFFQNGPHKKLAAQINKVLHNLAEQSEIAMKIFAGIKLATSNLAKNVNTDHNFATNFDQSLKNLLNILPEITIIYREINNLLSNLLGGKQEPSSHNRNLGDSILHSSSHGRGQKHNGAQREQPELFKQNSQNMPGNKK